MLNTEEYTAILQETDRFAARTVAPLFEIADRPPEPAALESVFQTAHSMGILPAPGQTGFALWELAEKQAGFQLHLSTLLSLARHNAATALEMHLRSLAHSVLNSADEATDALVTIALDGQPGLGRYSLAKYLKGNPLDENDEAILAQYFPGSAGLFHVQAFNVATILLPFWQGVDGLEWRLYARENLELSEIPSHGLNELARYRARLRAGSQPLCTIAANAENAANFLRVLTLHEAALFAIQAGLAGHAWRKAKNYAFNRAQGGCLIKDHPAVQRLLLNCYAVWRSGEGLLRTLQCPGGLTELADTMAKRSTLEPLLYSAVTDALQVFGGYGYMQDYGMEKLLRDQNHLARLGGSAGDLRLFLAALELAES